MKPYKYTVVQLFQDALCVSRVRLCKRFFETACSGQVDFFVNLFYIRVYLTFI
jgi:hypothetical protein